MLIGIFRINYSVSCIFRDYFFARLKDIKLYEELIPRTKQQGNPDKSRTVVYLLHKCCFLQHRKQNKTSASPSSDVNIVFPTATLSSVNIVFSWLSFYVNFLYSYASFRYFNISHFLGISHLFSFFFIFINFHVL